MAITSFANTQGFVYGPFVGTVDQTLTGMTSNTIDAVGESIAMIGNVHFLAGPGTSKTISTTGKIRFLTGNVTFANAGTSFKIGIQDVLSTGLEDGTYDVSATLTGGGGGLTSGSFISTTMTTGTKTLTHGDLIAVVFEMTARGGTDSVQIQLATGTNGASAIPWTTKDTGAGPVKSSNRPAVVIETDDGTLAWLGFETYPFSWATTGNFNSGSTPDEYASMFQVPFACETSGATVNLFTLGACEIILYSDPLGTPVAQRTVTVAQTQSSNVGNSWLHVSWPSTYTLTANTNYAIAVRPTTATNISASQATIGSADVRTLMMCGATWQRGTRTNQSGAFGSLSTTTMLYAMPRISGIDTGSAGGGLLTHPGLTGGIRG